MDCIASMAGCLGASLPTGRKQKATVGSGACLSLRLASATASPAVATSKKATKRCVAAAALPRPEADVFARAGSVQKKKNG